MLARALGQLTLTLLRGEKFAEAEPLARECLAIRQKTSPDDWQTSDARSKLGGSLLGQGKNAASEGLLLAGYEGLKQREDKIPASSKPRLREALQRLVQLCEATGRADQMSEWQDKLAGLDRRETLTDSTGPHAGSPK